MENRALIPFLIAMMLLTGVCNTLLTKYQDNVCVRNCDSHDPKKRINFQQPVLQTAQMFIGEMGCWLVVGIIAAHRRFTSRRCNTATYEPLSTTDTTTEIANDAEEAGAKSGGDAILHGWRVMLLALPALCDILGTTLMNAGLLLVAASIYQMTRGALVLFVGLLSVIFLRRHLPLFQWLSLVGVVLGVAVVGLAGAIAPSDPASSSDDAPLPPQHARHYHLDGDVDRDTSESPEAAALHVVIGVLMIAGAQIFTASQFVLEEWILERSTIDPIRVVGWEGVFGFVLTIIGMVVLHLAIGRTDSGRHGPFDMVDGLRQMTTIPPILISSLLIMLSIGGFNFFGLSVTRSVSATSRSTIDTSRTLFIWMVSLGLGWETFKWLQVLGFALLVYSTLLFNGIVDPPFDFLRPNEEAEAVEPLLPEDPIVHS